MAARRVPPTPTSGPRAISDKETSIRAIREGDAAARNYTRNGDLCPAKLCFNTDVEAEDIAAADTITDQANQDGRAFFDTLFPDDVYTVEWKAKPRNMLVMEALGTYVMGDFPKNNGETDAQYYMRAAGAGARHRIFQQRFPLPPAFDCDHLDPQTFTWGSPFLWQFLCRYGIITKDLESRNSPNGQDIPTKAHSRRSPTGSKSISVSLECSAPFTIAGLARNNYFRTPTRLLIHKLIGHAVVHI